MYVATLRSETDQKLNIHGQGEIGFVQKDETTSLNHLYHHDPVRFVFPNPLEGEVPQAVIVTTSGGLVGGDRISLDFSTDEGASAMLMAQAAEKVYRSAGRDCRVDVSVTAGPGAWAEYLPQETILFDGARLNRTTRIDAGEEARVLAGEIIVLGRRGSGEVFQEGYLRETWEVRRNGALIWADTLLLEDDISTVLGHPACLDRGAIVATAIYTGEISDDQLAAIRAEFTGAPFRFGVTMVNGILVVRFIGQDALPVRTAFGRFWQSFRHETAGLPERLPRLWHI